MYQEGAFRTEGQTRVRAAMIGGSGPDVLVGRAHARASHQSPLSKHLSPPVTWSYLKLVFWSVLAFICAGWLVFYLKTTTRNVTTVASPALAAYLLIGAIAFGLVLALVVWHNHAVYAKQFAEWDRSFICQRCGAVSKP